MSKNKIVSASLGRWHSMEKRRYDLYSTCVRLSSQGLSGPAEQPFKVDHSAVIE